MDKNNNDVNKFWLKFREAVIENGIGEKYADHYVKWAQKFALSIKGIPLTKRSLDDIKRFIDKVKNEKNVQEWKVKQARESIYILYYKFLKIEAESLQSGNNQNYKKDEKPSTDKNLNMVTGRRGWGEIRLTHSF